MKATNPMSKRTTLSQSLMSKTSTSQKAATISEQSTVQPSSNQLLSSTTTTTMQPVPTKPFISTVQKTVSSAKPTPQQVATLSSKLSTADNSVVSTPLKLDKSTESSTIQLTPKSPIRINTSTVQPKISTMQLPIKHPSAMTSTTLEKTPSKSTSMRTPAKPVTSGKVSENPTPSLPDSSVGQPTPSPLNPDVSRGGPTLSPTLQTFGLSSYSPTVCSQNFSEPNPKCCHVCACPGEEVFGRVLNEVGEPIAKAQVYFSGCNCVRYLTDPSGNYAIQNICVKGHEMNFEAAGYLASIVLPVPVVQGGRFWKANNILNLKPFVPGLNVTEAPKRN